MVAWGKTLPPIILNDTNYPKKLHPNLDLEVKTVDIRWNWERCTTQFYRITGSGGLGQNPSTNNFEWHKLSQEIIP